MNLAWLTVFDEANGGAHERSYDVRKDWLLTEEEYYQSQHRGHAPAIKQIPQ